MNTYVLIRKYVGTSQFDVLTKPLPKDRAIELAAFGNFHRKGNSYRFEIVPAESI